MIRLLKRYIKNYFPALMGNILFVALQIVIQTVFIMSEMKNILDNGVAANNMTMIWQSGLKMLLFTIASGVCTIISSYLSARVTAGVTCDIRKACFKKVTSMSSQSYNRFGASTLSTRTMADVMQIQILIINILRTSLMVPMIIVCMLFLIFRINRMLFWVMFVSFAVTVFSLAFLGAKSKPLFEVLQKKIDRISMLMKEKLSGVRAIRAFRNQDLEEKKLEEANDEVYKAAISANAKINFLAPLSLIIMNWAVVLIYFVGTKQLQIKMASISDLLLIFQYLAYFISSIAVIPVLVNLLPKVSVSCARINALLDDAGDAAPNRNNVRSGIEAGKVEFSNVIFGYSGATNVITDITFTAKPGKTTAFIGTTGSGKTTIMNLLMRLYQMNFGEIKIDGTSIRDYDPDYLRSRISYGTQKAMVFQDTVYNNISAYNKECSEERVRLACDAAEFSEVLEKMPDGTNSMMAQGGMNISGGQRQRLSLARTIAKDAAIYIFDDTFSALDSKTEASVRKNIKNILKGKTIIMVAQKISTIADADNIIVLDKGRIAGQGTHAYLLENCDEYKEIYNTQCYTEKQGP